MKVILLQVQQGVTIITIEEAFKDLRRNLNGRLVLLVMKIFQVGLR